MLWDDLQNWKGSIEINGIKYNSVKDAEKSFSADISTIDSIILYTTKEDATERKKSRVESVPRTLYKITVKQYMTKPASPSFDFMSVWNNDVPMPLRTMVGTVEKETPGMVYMKLHGDLLQKVTPRCLKCGKPITNPVSQYFGMGPECGNHNYVNPFNTEEELKEAVEKYRIEVLQNIKWEGWIPKSAILTNED